MVIEKKSGDIPEVDLSGYTIDPAVVKLIPASTAEKHKIIPLFKVGNSLTLAMADPRNIVALDEARWSRAMSTALKKRSPNITAFRRSSRPS
jgi:type IV pilus assembly protein PilB